MDVRNIISTKTRPIAICRPTNLKASDNQLVDYHIVGSMNVGETVAIRPPFDQLNSSTSAELTITAPIRTSTASVMQPLPDQIKLYYNKPTGHCGYIHKRSFRKKSVKLGRLCRCGHASIFKKGSPAVKLGTRFKLVKSFRGKCGICHTVQVSLQLIRNDQHRLLIKIWKQNHLRGKQRLYRLKKQVENNQRKHAPKKFQGLINSQYHLAPPLVDGKVVAMLRRLGTTLSAEPINLEDNQSNSQVNNCRRQLPKIMSPAKPKPLWPRKLADDEVVVNFQDTIHEVIASLISNVWTGTETNESANITSTNAKKKLTFDEE